MTVDKHLFERQPVDTYDFYEGRPQPWRSDDEVNRYVPTHCCYCGVQCAMYLKVAGGEVVGVEPRYDFPFNHGMLCPKGTTAYQTVNHPDRLTHPLMRRGGKGSPLERVSWDEALDTVAQRFRAIQAEYGKDAVVVYSGSSMTNETCYLMGTFARVALGTRHCDYNGRLCMSSATGANERSLGIDRAANPISDALHANVIVVIGANVGECFPIVTSYLWQARDRGTKLIVADPRQTPIARTTDVFLPLRPGTDSALLNGMLNVIIREGLIDEAFIRERTTGWEETRALAEQYPPDRVAKVCGLRAETIVEAARLFGQAQAALIYTARGLEHQSKGVDNGVAAANLALATGNFGRPGAGYMTLTGQGNGQGGREMGQKASQLPGERDIEDPDDRAYIAQVWGIDEHELPHAGYPATLMIPAMERGEIRACFMSCSNPMVSLPDQHTVERALRQLDLFVVCDFFLSETCELADVVLPGNVWAEDEGTSTSLEGRVIKYNRAVDLPGEARLDWVIVCDLARRMGKGAYFDFHSQREIFEELRRCTMGAKADYAGITYEKIEQQNGVFWPCPTDDHPGTPRLYEARFGFADGKARFHPVTYLPPAEEPAEEPDDEYPLVLTTGRVIYHYLSGNQTRRTPFLFEQAPCPWVEIHEQTAERLCIGDGDWVTVRTRRGELTAPALVVRSLRFDTIFIPYHYGHTQAANILTNPVLEPMNKIPEYKVCAAAVTKASEPPPWAQDIDPQALRTACGRRGGPGVGCPALARLSDRACLDRGPASDLRATSDRRPTEMAVKRIFLDPSRCIGCRACVAACRECDTHKGETMVFNDFIDRGNTVATSPTLCMHCEEPLAPCAQVCPAQAILVSPDGVVHQADESRCINIRNCVYACPFGVSKFDGPARLMRKCNLCYDRTSIGLSPMCASVCPTQAIFYGTYEEWLAAGRAGQGARPVNVFTFGRSGCAHATMWS